VRGLGVVELIVGTAALAGGGRFAAAALAILYLGFAGFLVRLRRVAGAAAPCGCAGTAIVASSHLHIAIDVLAAVTAAVMMARPVRSIRSVAAGLPFKGVGFVIGVATIAYISYLVVAFLPTTMAAYRRAARS
jgi:Methylamine utilisation protein MauE